MQLAAEMEWEPGRMEASILGTTTDMSSSSGKDRFHRKKDACVCRRWSIQLNPVMSRLPVVVTVQTTSGPLEKTGTAEYCFHRNPGGQTYYLNPVFRAHFQSSTG